ncbi:MAG: DUF4912 domain-containing protein, partial [Thermotogota bacterium]|nr:DUF4912 domain-containing protein [Thermotogota bacterium]
KRLLDTFRADEPTIQELRNIAKNLGVKLKRNMNKKEILKSVRKEIKKLEDSLNQQVEEVSDYTKLPKNPQKHPKSNESKELPQKYGRDKFKLLPVNPNWVYAYWNFSEKSQKKLKKLSKNSNIAIRIIKKSTENQEAEKKVIETDIKLDQNDNHYVNLPQDNSTYVAFLGVKNEDGEFTPLIESNEITTPSSSIKSSDKEEWFLIEDGKIIKQDKKEEPGLWNVEKHPGSSETMFTNKRKFNDTNLGSD